MYKLILGIVCFYGLLMTPIQAKPSLPCQGKAKDILFVLDASSSVYPEDFSKQLKFVADLVSSFKVEHGRSQVRVGIITFSDHAHLEYPLVHFSDISRMNETIFGIAHRTGNTNTAEALELARSEIEKVEQGEGPIAAVVITDGKSRNPEATKLKAKKLHQLGINVFAVGVGNAHNINELKAIASDPVNGVYTVSSYSVLKEITQKLYAQSCFPEVETTTTTTSTKQPSTLPTGILNDQPTEMPREDKDCTIIFGYDIMTMGNFRITMISKFIDIILSYSCYDYFGVISHGYCPENFNIPVRSLKNKKPSEIQNSVTVDINLPSLTDTVRRMRSEMHNRAMQSVQSGRVEKQVALLFIDPSVTTITPELIEETEKMKNQGVKVYVISVGQESQSQSQNVQLVNSQLYVNYRYQTYEQLLDSARYNPSKFRAMCSKACKPIIY